jgi:hypothetical protein
MTTVSWPWLPCIVDMDVAMLSMTARMSANSSVNLALGGGDVNMAAEEVDIGSANDGGGGVGGGVVEKLALSTKML